MNVRVKKAVKCYKKLKREVFQLFRQTGRNAKVENSQRKRINYPTNNINNQSVFHDFTLNWLHQQNELALNNNFFNLLNLRS